MHINDLAPANERHEAIAQGLMAEKVSEDGKKVLYCYTPRAQFQNAWNAVTTQLRGVTVDANTGEILSRPFGKFFNYGDPNAPKIHLNARVTALDKMDGSLAVLQPDGTMTSKGSFTSSQALAATKLYQEKYAGKWEPKTWQDTYCFEYTAPDNRIVLDYGPEPELTLIGVVAKSDGFMYRPDVAVNDDGWTGPVAEIVAYMKPFHEILAMEPRESAEGLVVLAEGGHSAIKLKQPQYLAMHAIVTNTNARTVWEAMAVNDCIKNGSTPEQLKRDLQLGPDKIERAMELGEGWLEKLSEGVPDEFHEWLVDTAIGLGCAFDDALYEAARRRREYAKTEDRGFVARDLQANYGNDSLPWNISLDIWMNGGQLTSRSRTGLWRHIRPGHSTWGPTVEEEE